MRSIPSAEKPALKLQRATSRPARFWVKRVLLGVVMTMIALAVLGTLYQTVSTLLDSHRYPPPGQRVDVGGYALHLHCLGTGTPTVILESGQGGLSRDWAWIQPEVAKSTRVCSYDRAGIGWSDPGPRPRDARQIAQELHTLLVKATVPGPYILVGHSYGGLYVRAYAAAYRDTVVGLVLVDASHPDQWLRVPDGKTQYAQTKRLYGMARVLTRLGVLRLTGFNGSFRDLPPQQAAEHKAMADSVQFVDTASAEFNASAATSAQIREAGTLANEPLFILSATEHGRPELETLAQELQRELAELSSNSVHQVVEGTSHASLIIDRNHAQMTSAAILRVLETVLEQETVTLQHSK